MDIKGLVEKIVPEMDSADKVYGLFKSLNYPESKILDPTYKRRIEEFDFAKEEREKLKDIYTVFNYDGKLQILLIEAKSLSVHSVRYLTKHLSGRYLRFLLILTTDYKEYTFVFPEFERIEEGKHKLKLTRLNLDRNQPYHTDLLTISNIALRGDEEDWKDIWKRWKDAFSVEKVTDSFFEDYKNAFFEIRKTFEKQKIPVKNSHELSQQFLNRLMFLYFISKKRWLNDDSKFIKWYWDRYREEKRKGNAKDNTFYEDYLKMLFLEAFNNKYSHPHYHPKDVEKILAAAPYLNGGLFHRNELDDLPFSISDSLFEKVFSFFEKYNFTIREDIPLDIEVAVDPQMIGYVYESLSNVAEEIYERQDLGIFYTPTIEVDFMCRRSLVEYLNNHFAGTGSNFSLSRGVGGVFPPLEKPPTEIPPLEKGGEGGFGKDWIYRLLFDEDKKEVAEYISKNNLWYRLEEALDNLAVVDPACGSGAFLVGMLHVLAELYRLIYSHINREMTEFELKKKVIGNSLYGVDVMPWAVHSAELRLWLQLIIEEDIPYEQRKLFPLLPNLNLKLRVGDSLVQEVGGISLHVRDSRLSPSLKRKLTSLKTEKEKYFNNDPTAKFKNHESLLQEELRIFGEILDDKIINLQKEIQGIEGEKRKLQIEMFKDSEKESEKQKNLFEEQIKAKGTEIEHLRETRRKIQSPEKKPFIWDIDFAEIFGDKGGFDIVIGNPPYVRQEKIAPPNKLKAEVMLEDKREYKDKLLSSIQVHYPFVKKLDKKSDYYIYFYFHGLSLLNDKGTFCFITSNSWLDVGYGKDLQEFLLKYCHIKAVYDNEAKRSFEHADVNTIIALFGSPLSRVDRGVSSPLSRGVGGVFWPALSETARFVMFKDAFDKVINTKNLLAIEKTEAIQKTESYRVYPVKQEALLEEGWEQPEEESEESGVSSQKSEEKNSPLSRGVGGVSDLPPLAKGGKGGFSLLKEKFLTGKYEGNKWGGKYLRAPDIFFTILEKGAHLIDKMSNYFDGERYLNTGGADGFFIVTEVIPQKNGLFKIRNDATVKKKENVFSGLIEEKYLIPTIKDYVKKDKKIVIDGFDAYCLVIDEKPATIKKTYAYEYIKWGENQGYHHRSVTKSQKPWYKPTRQMLHSSQILVPRSFYDRHVIHYNPNNYLSLRFYRLHLKRGSTPLLIAFLNTTYISLFLETLGNKSLGQGVLDFFMADFLNLRIPIILDEALLKPFEEFKKRNLRPLLDELGINPALPIREQKPNPLPDRKALDDIIFDILGLTEDERNEVYWAVCELVKNRLEKARSV